MDTLTAMLTRRAYGRLSAPAPSAVEIRLLLEAAAAAPDHGALRPFRFTVLQGETQDAFGVVLEAAYRKRCRAAQLEPDAAKAAKERAKLGRAPLVIVVAAARQSSEKIPWADQRDAAVASAMSIVLAAHALGYGAIWRTGTPCDDDDVKSAIGRAPDDAIVGFIYIGTIDQPKAAKPIDLDGLIAKFPISVSPSAKV